MTDDFSEAKRKTSKGYGSVEDPFGPDDDNFQNVQKEDRDSTEQMWFCKRVWNKYDRSFM